MMYIKNRVLIGFFRVPVFFNTFFFLLLIITSFHTAFSQDIHNDQIKRTQRAIYIFNFAQQVSWENFEELAAFKIGVLGPDRTISDLRSMSSNRTMFGKPIEVKRLQLVKEIEDIQLLYVNQKYNYDIDYILSKIEGKSILLVTEDYEFNASMINIVNVGNSFEYEINEKRIRDAGFGFSPSLKLHGITSAKHWKELYRSSKASLEKTLGQKNIQIGTKEQEIEQKEQTIREQHSAIDTIRESVLEGNKQIQELLVESNLQQKKYKEKLRIEQELEQNIQEQIAFIKIQERKIAESDQQIKTQLNRIGILSERIEEQEQTLSEQLTSLIGLGRITTILTILLFLILIGAILLYRGFVQKKKLNKDLRFKNQEINKQAEELQSKNKELEQFAYIASHDLQEPLNTISSFIGLIDEEYGDSFDDEGKESLIFIKDASIRMKRLIDALLEYSRLGRSKDFAEVDMSEVLEELRSDFRNVLERSKAKIYAEKLPVVKGNHIELRLLIQNLVSNGIKFTEEGVIPEIRISAKKNHNQNKDASVHWQFMVKDNGIGIPEKHQDRIFAIFQRLHSREKYQGTGIGLAHCKKIVESHGGKIWIKSKEGEGTTFYFTIPE